MARSERIIDINFLLFFLFNRECSTKNILSSGLHNLINMHSKIGLRVTGLVLLSAFLFFLWQNSMVRQTFFIKCVFCFFSLQVAGGGDGSQGQIEIFSLNRPMPRAVKSLQIGSAVRCLEYVPVPSPTEEAEAGVHKYPTGIGTNICVGLDDGR